MDIEENRAAGLLPSRTAYGRFVRERGTLKVIIAAVAVVLTQVYPSL